MDGTHYLQPEVNCIESSNSRNGGLYGGLKLGMKNSFSPSLDRRVGAGVLRVCVRL